MHARAWIFKTMCRSFRDDAKARAAKTPSAPSAASAPPTTCRMASFPALRSPPRCASLPKSRRNTTSPDSLDYIQRFKNLFDPAGRLNPGKVLPTGKGCLEIRQAPLTRRTTV